MKIDTVIFDFDGTLANSLPGLVKSTNFTLEHFGYPKRTEEEVKSFVGNGVEMLLRRAFPPNSSDEFIKNALTVFKEDYDKNPEIVVYDGIYELLKNLKSENIKTAVISNKYDLMIKFLCEKYFSGLIDFACGECEKIPPKPDPKGILTAIKTLNAKKPIYVGDSEVDIQSAKNAKIPCISVTYGFKTREFLIKNNAEILCDTPTEVFEQIKNFDRHQRHTNLPYRP